MHECIAFAGKAVFYACLKQLAGDVMGIHQQVWPDTVVLVPSKTASFIEAPDTWCFTELCEQVVLSWCSAEP